MNLFSKYRFLKCFSIMPLAQYVMLISLASLGLMNVARADDCDYVGRHNRANLTPIALTAATVPRSGDIEGGQSLTIRIANYGERAVDYPARAGDLFHANGVYVNLGGREYLGWLRAPLNPGTQADLTIFVSAGTIRNCQDVTLTIDSRRSAHQFGCNVYGDDTKTFHRVHITGSLPCRFIPIPARPGHHPF